MTFDPTRIEPLVEACETAIATYLGDDAASIDTYNRTFADLAKALDPHCADDGPDEKLVVAFRLGQQSREHIVAAVRECGEALTRNDDAVRALCEVNGDAALLKQRSADLRRTREELGAAHRRIESLARTLAKKGG